MPNKRNFYGQWHIDGKKNDITGGTRGEKDGMSFDLYVKDDVRSRKVVNLNCWVGEDGLLHVSVAYDDVCEVLTFNDKAVKQ